MAKNYFNRYVWLIDTVLRHGHISFAEVDELWQASALNEDGSALPARTFHNHREAILETFGIEIKFDKALGYYIGDGDMNADGLRSWLLTSVSVNNIVNGCAGMRDRIILEEIPSGQKHLTTVIEAMRDGRMLEMEYRKFNDSQPRTIVIAPYCIKLFRQRWYMVGRTAEHPRPAIYALDRILCLKGTDRSFKIPARFDAEDYFSGWFGIVHDEENYKPEKIRLKVWDRQRHYFRTLPLHDSQKEVEEHDGWSVFEYFMAPAWDLEQELLKYNDCVEVLEPQSLREQMIEHIDNMKAVYDGRYND